jgi:hypothetical protein
MFLTSSLWPMATGLVTSEDYHCCLTEHWRRTVASPIWPTGRVGYLYPSSPTFRFISSIRVSSMAWRLEGIAGRYAGGGSITGRGGMWRGPISGTSFLGCSVVVRLECMDFYVHFPRVFIVFNYPQGKFLSHFIMHCVCILQTPDGVRHGLCVAT